jgi:hypothetical protein
MRVGDRPGAWGRRTPGQRVFIGVLVSIFFIVVGLKYCVLEPLWEFLALRSQLPAMERLNPELDPETDVEVLRLEAQLAEARQDVKEWREKVREEIRSGDLPKTGSNVYMRAVADLDALIEEHNLYLSNRYEVDGLRQQQKGGKVVGRFRQRYEVYGRYVNVHDLLKELDGFPYLCHFEDISLQVVGGPAMGGRERLLRFDFDVVIYYLPEDVGL